MSKLILHVGIHKTGSTAVQEGLAAARRALAAEGIVYPKIGRGTAHHALIAPWNGLVAEYAAGIDPQGVWRRLVREHARSDRTVILSSEEIARQGGRHAADLGWIADAVSAFDAVEVIAVLRDQIGLLQSIWLQVARNGAAAPRAWPRFLKQAEATRRATDLPLDHGVLYGALCAAFGAGNVTLHDHAALRARPGGTVGAILAAAGASAVAPEDAAPSDPQRANVSPAPLAVWAARQISGAERPDPALIACAARTIAAVAGEGEDTPPTTLYRPEEADRVRAAFEAPNAALRAAVAAAGGTPPALAWPDLTGAVHRGQVNRTAFWIALARALRGVPVP